MRWRLTLLAEILIYMSNGLQQMNKYQVTASLVPNLFQLDQLPFIKKEVHRLIRFKDKEKLLPLFRNLTYQCKNMTSKLFVFNFSEEKKDKKKIRFLEIITEREIINLKYLYQIMNENMDQQMFSHEVQKIKQFQHDLYSYIDSLLSRSLLMYKKKDYLSLNIYKVKDQFYLKGTLNDYNFYLEMIDQPKRYQKPQPYRVTNSLVKQQLIKKYKQLEKMNQNKPFGSDVQKLYQKFYDRAYFLYDQFVLKLQVYNNYPMLRLKNYIPIKFQDFATKEPLQGPIFSNSDPQCMYGHFLGYNANNIKIVEGKHCQNCQALIQQLQQNELLMFLRDNILNPQRSDLYYNPEYNRFKLLAKKAITVQTQGQMAEEKIFYKTYITYLNYYHFRINLKRMSSKIRMRFTPTSSQESFPLTFQYGNQKILIIDPARGKYCQHYAFTDLRLYYSNYDAQTNLYKCPISGCSQTITDGDIIYLKEVIVLMDFIKFKCEEFPELHDCSKIAINHSNQKLFVIYKARQQGAVVSKVDELVDFYKTMVDPFIPFPEYSLGIKEKERKQKMEEYMFGGLREEMERQQIQEEEEEDQLYQQN